MRRTAERDDVGARALRVVMVVANDVTRDSRVLREAAALADAGHRVTVIGMLTPRTTAPRIEHADGFTIWRIPYRARPPAWWVPADFHVRLRAQLDREMGVQRAAFRRAWARRPGLPRTAHPLRRVRRRVSRRARSVARRLVHGFPRRVAGTPAGRRLARALRVARTTPLRRWPLVLRRAGYRVATRHRRYEHLSPASRRRSTLASIFAAVGLASMAASRSAGERWARVTSAMRTAGAACMSATDGFVRTWIGLAAVAVWGTAYLGANAVSRGALEWMTGWRWRWLGWAAFVEQHAPAADVWHGHDLTSLPAVVELKRRRGGLAIYDSHELYVESGRHATQPRWAKAILQGLERRLVRDVDAVLTVNQSIRDLLADRLGTEEIAVVHNCPSVEPIQSRRSIIREALDLPADAPLMLYHGSLAPHRGIEQLLDAVCDPMIADVHLAFLGYGTLEPWLRAVSDNPRYGGRVHVLDGVPPGELLDWIVGVDVAVVPIQPSTINHVYSSPNKVFEALAVGTPIAGSDFPEFRKVVLDDPDGPLGVLFDPTSPGQIADAVRQLTSLDADARRDLRERCARSAQSRWNWHRESRTLIGLYGQLADRSSLPALEASAA